MIDKPTLNGVYLAFSKLKMVVPPTPLIVHDHGSARLWLKCESDQPMGAFKLRGAWHRLTALAEDQKAAGVVAFSSGNHAQGVAWAARKLGMPALIVMPADAPALKVEGTRALGAEIVFYDRMTESREEIAARIAEERGAVLVPSFDDPWIIEGQGSVGLEALEQGPEGGFDMVITPCGGGGLAAGLALALPDAALVVAEPAGWDDMGESLRCGHIVPVGPNPPPTACDALQTLRVSPLTFDVLKAHGTTGVAVSEAETGAAMRFAWQHLGKRVEPGGAVALAAILADKVPVAGNVLVLLSGGNVDDALFQAMVGG